MFVLYLKQQADIRFRNQNHMLQQVFHYLLHQFLPKLVEGLLLYLPLHGILYILSHAVKGIRTERDRFLMHHRKSGHGGAFHKCEPCLTTQVHRDYLGQLSAADSSAVEPPVS